jgi:hypothetical protein
MIRLTSVFLGSTGDLLYWSVVAKGGLDDWADLLDRNHIAHLVFIHFDRELVHNYNIACELVGIGVECRLHLYQVKLSSRAMMWLPITYLHRASLDCSDGITIF